MMRTAISLIVALLFGACATPPLPTPSITKSWEYPSAEAGEFSISGVLHPGVKHVSDELTLTKAIQDAGGLRNCNSCFKVGGEALLWKWLGPAYIWRDSATDSHDLDEPGTISVPKGQFDTFKILSGDRIMISHIAM